MSTMANRPGGSVAWLRRAGVRVVLSCVLAVAAALPHTAHATDPIIDVIDVPIPIPATNLGFELADVRRIIFNSCIRRGWTPRIVDDRIVASILVRERHYAEVEITYTTATYSIRYKDSRELDYDAETREIHGNYNGWVARLSRDIQREFQAAARQAAPPGPALR